MSSPCSCKGSVHSGARRSCSRRKGDVDTRHMLAQRRHYACHACIRVKQAERKWIGCHRISPTDDASQYRVVSSSVSGRIRSASDGESPNSMEKAVGLLGGRSNSWLGLSEAITGTVGEFAWAGRTTISTPSATALDSFNLLMTTTWRGRRSQTKNYWRMAYNGSEQKTDQKATTMDKSASHAVVAVRIFQITFCLDAAPRSFPTD